MTGDLSNLFETTANPFANIHLTIRIYNIPNTKLLITLPNFQYTTKKLPFNNIRHPIFYNPFVCLTNTKN